MEEAEAEEVEGEEEGQGNFHNIKPIHQVKESTETYLLELTPYKGLCIVVCLLNGH